MQNILVAIDLSPVTEQVLAQAAQLAKNLSCHVWLIHIAPPDPDFIGYDTGPQTVREQVATKLHREHHDLQSHADKLRQAGLQVTPLLIRGATVESILQEARRIGADLIVIGSHGHGALYRALVGGVCEGLLRHTHIPLFIVPDPARLAKK